MKKGYFLIICFIFFIISGSVFAQEPEFLFTWQAETSSPDWYEGKEFPSYGSIVNVAFEAIEKNGVNKGKFIDLSQREIWWYLGGNLVKKGVGLQSLRINNNDYPGKDIAVKVTIPEYYDSQLGKSYEVSHYEYIPIVSPRVVGDYYQFTNRVLPGKKLLISAYPFFFNAQEDGLKVMWKIANKDVSIDPTQKYALYVDIPQETPRSSVFPVEVSVSQVGKLFSSATFFERFIIE